VVSDSTVRRRSGESSTTWSIARTPFACSAGIAATASDLVVGIPSRSWSEPSDGKPRHDHPTIPAPRSGIGRVGYLELVYGDAVVAFIASHVASEYCTLE
jgi:hypothetical protein